MVNAIYTLLRNLPGTVLTGPTGEFVDPTYQPVTLPPALQTIRAILFGANPDAVALAYRLRQYCTILHSGRYAPFMTALDTRITYWPFTDAAPFAFGVSITPVGSAGTISLIGVPVQEAASGVTQYTFTLTTA